MRTPEVSIIVPVYKAENTLRKCIDSILTQSVSDIELLLIDDGSPDSSGKICENYREKDDRVQVFHKPNNGVSSARNVGLEKARGKWIAFVDSDDYVDEHFVKNLTIAAKSTGSQLVQAGFNKISNEGLQTVNAVSNIISMPLLSEDLLSYLRGFSFSKLYVREIIEKNGLKFDETLTLAEDLCFVLEYVSHIDRITFIPDSNYYYVEYKTSASFKLHKPRSLLRLWQVENSVLNKLQEKFIYINMPEWQKDVGNYVFDWIISWIIHYASGPFDKGISKELERFYDEYYLLLEKHRMRSFIKRHLTRLILNRKFTTASFLLFIIGKYRQKRYNYEV